jgi:16S rRNA (guanine527-N7)-methyltransferase
VKPEDLLAEGLRALDLRPTKKRIDAFMRYLRELKKWNRVYSLTSLRTDRDIVIKHFLDSSLYLKAFDEPPRSLADVGSGAGFPGVPVKILRPKIEVYLIEPSGKKAAFLRNVIRRLGLKGITVIEKRVEDVWGIEVDAAVTRALYRAGDFLRRAGHIVGDGGVLVLSKGPKAGEELEGLDLECGLRKFALPHTGIKRNLIIVKADEEKSEGGPYPKAEKRSRKIKPPARGICVNFECKLRRAGCFGFEGCPGYMSRG